MDRPLVLKALNLQRNTLGEFSLVRDDEEPVAVGYPNDDDSFKATKSVQSTDERLLEEIYMAQIIDQPDDIFNDVDDIAICDPLTSVVSYDPSVNDLVRQLNKEINSVVNVSDTNVGCVENNGSNIFVWSAPALRLLKKLVLQFRSDKETCGADERKAEIVNWLENCILPLWPQGWMTMNQLVESVLPEINDESNDYDYESNSNSASDCTQLTAMLAKDGDSLKIATQKQQERFAALQNDTQCFICNRSFQNPHMLKIHISHMHTPKVYVCPHCQNRHATFNGLRCHISSKHKGVKVSSVMQYSTMMGAPTNSPSSIQQQHSSPATGNSSPATASVSARNVRPLNIVTKYTPLGGMKQQIVSPIRIRFSQDSESGESSKPMIQCSSCPHRFLTPGALKAHVSMIHTEKVIRCKYCPNMYATQRAMLQHTYLKHHKERNCQCPECGATFATLHLVNSHRRYAHAVFVDSHQKGESTGNGTSSGVVAAGQVQEGRTQLMKRPRLRTATGRIDDIALDIRQRQASQLGHTVGLATSKEKIRARCSVCSAAFSNGYACYLHKRKVHGDDAIRRELNLREKSRSSASASSSAISVASRHQSSEDQSKSAQRGDKASSTGADGGLNMKRDSSATEFAVRRRYEFRCECGQTFNNGFAFSRHRQRTGCSDNVRGVLVKEAVCTFCHETFVNTELLNEHVARHHHQQQQQQRQQLPHHQPPKQQLQPMHHLRQQLQMDNTMPNIARSSSNGEILPSSSARFATPQSAPSNVYRTSAKSIGKNGIDQLDMPVTTREELADDITWITDEDHVDNMNKLTQDSSMRCLLCPYQSLNWESLKEHRQHHRDTTAGIQNKCPYCSYVADGNFAFAHHMLLHYPNRNAASTRRRMIVDTEKTSRIEGLLNCAFCGRGFPNTHLLSEHELLHSSTGSGYLL